MNGQRRNELIGDTLRRFVRRGARPHISKLLGKTRPEDVALHFPGLTPTEQMEVFRILIDEHLETAGEVLIELDSPIQQELLEALSTQDIARVLDEMSVDDAVSLVDSLPDDLRDKLVEIVDRKDLSEVQEHLTYGDDTAGRIMDTDLLALAQETTVAETISHIQKAGDLDNVFYL